PAEALANALALGERLGGHQNLVNDVRQQTRRIGRRGGTRRHETLLSGGPARAGATGTPSRGTGRYSCEAAIQSLDFDGRSCFFQLLLELRGLVLVDALLDGLRHALDEVLGLL